MQKCDNVHFTLSADIQKYLTPNSYLNSLSPIDLRLFKIQYRSGDRLVRQWDFVRLEEVFSAISIGKCVGWKQNQISRTSQSPLRYLVIKILRSIKNTQSILVYTTSVLRIANFLYNKWLLLIRNGHFLHGVPPLSILSSIGSEKYENILINFENSN